MSEVIAELTRPLKVFAELAGGDRRQPEVIAELTGPLEMFAKLAGDDRRVRQRRLPSSPVAGGDRRAHWSSPIVRGCLGEL